MKIFAFVLALTVVTTSVFAAPTEVSFIAPKNGDKLSPTFKVKFGLVGMKLRPAGEDVKDKTSGHHHLIIDGDFITEGKVIPTDATHLHFGKGQTETEVTLAKGKHKLTLQLADGAHLSYGKKLSATIEVVVE